jgi:hypothetical protein
MQRKDQIEERLELEEEKKLQGDVAAPLRA